MALCAVASFVLYALMLGVVRDLSSAEPSYAGEVFPWVELRTRETIAEERYSLVEGEASERHSAASARFLALLLGLFSAYGLTLWAVAGRRSSALAATCFGAGALFLAVQAVGPAMLSTDVYAYTVYGRIFALYGGDPYAEIPYQQYPDDPYLPLVYWLDLPSWYGPLWTLISGGLARLGSERIGLTVLLFRGVAIVAALASAALIWSGLRRTDRDRAAQGLVFFLWNPLLVLETGLSGHNDAVMVALLLLGIWLHLRGRRVLAVAAMTFSPLVKFLTGLVVPLYGLMVLRHLGTWRERGRFVGMSAIGAILVVGIVLVSARIGLEMPVVQAAAGTRFYENNVHELLSRALRLWLGEDPESVRVPMSFEAWWVTAQVPAELRSAPEPSAESLGRIEPGTALLVLAPRSGDWLQVYRPGTGDRGHISGGAVVETERPDGVDSDPVLARLEAGPGSSPTVARANAMLRLLTWGAFGAFWLLAAWRARDVRSFLVWSAGVMLASCWLVAIETWPWYVIWALALAALVPTSWAARLAGILSATVLSLYISLGYQGSDQEWIYTYRSLPAFVLPLVLFPLSYAVQGRARPRLHREADR